MRQLRGGFLCLGTAVALVAGILVLLSGWLTPGPDSLLSPENLLREQQRDRQLSDDIDALNRILEAKQALARDVADGRLRLAEAARRFHDLDAGAPHFNTEAFRRAYPGSSDEERYCREVIGYAAAAVDDEPSRAAAVRLRLEAELDDHLQLARPTPVGTARTSAFRPLND
jgi:hypothetical protein